MIRLISETWHVYSTDSLKKSSSKAIPRSQTKVTFCPNPIGFPFLTKEVWCLWTLNVFCYQSGRRFELIGGMGGWRQATQSQGGSCGAKMIKKTPLSHDMWLNHLGSMSYPIDRSVLQNPRGNRLSIGTFWQHHTRIWCQGVVNWIEIKRILSRQVCQVVSWDLDLRWVLPQSQDSVAGKCIYSSCVLTRTYLSFDQS